MDPQPPAPDQRLSSDSNPALLAFRLDSYAPLRVSGSDAQDFLQGQLSADLRSLSPLRGRWSSYNNPKGRVLAIPLLLRDGETIELWLPRSLIEAVSKRLRIFVLRAKVMIEARGANTEALGVHGGEAPAWLAARGLPVPAHTLDVAEDGALRVLRAAGVLPRFLILAPPERIKALAPQAPPDDAAWRRADILAGIPQVQLETQDRWVAQMTNLDLIGGISFDKGCYTGQEVVARLHYLGNLKKRMFLVRGSGDVPTPGSAIRASGNEGQSVGEIVDAVSDDASGFIASAVLQLAHIGSAELVTQDGARLAIPQAYPYPEADDYSVR